LREADAPAFITPNGIVTVGQVFAEAFALAERLPDVAYLINYCEDRYEFAVTFLAAAIRGQCNVLLPSHSATLLNSASRQFSDAAVVTSSKSVPTQLPIVRVAVAGGVPAACSGNAATFSADSLVAAVYTSGTTGSSRQIKKTIGELTGGADSNAG